jgi:hypothetical protein
VSAVTRYKYQWDRANEVEYACTPPEYTSVHSSILKKYSPNDEKVVVMKASCSSVISAVATSPYIRARKGKESKLASSEIPSGNMRVDHVSFIFRNLAI